MVTPGSQFTANTASITPRTDTQEKSSMKSGNNAPPKQTLSCRDFLIGPKHFCCYSLSSVNGKNINDKPSSAVNANNLSTDSGK